MKFAGVRIGLGRVGYLQQDVRVAGLIERTPAGQVFPSQAGPEITLVEGFTGVLAIECHGFFRTQSLAADQF
jgi:hypothetical protein